jgi:hypothetical protein
MSPVLFQLPNGFSLTPQVLRPCSSYNTGSESLSKHQSVSDFIDDFDRCNAINLFSGTAEEKLQTLL